MTTNKAKHVSPIMIQRRLSNAILREKKLLEQEGFDVPSFSVSVKDNYNKIDWKPYKYYNKSYGDYLNEIRDTYGLSMTEVGIIYTLSFYIGYENNLLTKASGDPILKKDLIEILELDKTTIDKYMNNLVAKGVFAKIKVRRSVNYYLDPRISYQGNRIDKTLLSMFHISC
ncbi:hypothetical protein [Vallitalea okinawensis]|uniref:hypothetical protein n=1 Tax=Vallitalea okinawensis TaxID=2078660 RepID=UPI000CFB5FC8|nr:hypothetical protein [Vallitalea okinawensis]